MEYLAIAVSITALVVCFITCKALFAQNEARHETFKQSSFIQIKIDSIMSALTDLEALVGQVQNEQIAIAASQVAIKASLDATNAGIAKIVAGLNPGGLSADDVTTLKGQLNALLTSEQANATAETANQTEAASIAATVAADQPAPTPAPAPAAPTA